MALGVFILCGCFNITRLKFTCMATWLPYKTACVSIINVLVIDSLPTGWIILNGNYGVIIFLPICSRCMCTGVLHVLQLF